MIKVGKNDPCPCGSGKKYKRCCLENDKHNNVTRIAPESDGENKWLSDVDPKQIDYAALAVLIEEELNWMNTLYQLVGKRILDNMIAEYDAAAIATGIFLWNAYSLENQPITRKVDVYPAAVEYAIAQLAGRTDVTQGMLAQKYNLSVGTISQRANQLWEFTLKQAEERKNEGIDDLAEFTGSPEELLAYYKQGMIAGERELGQAFFQENKGHFWGLIETRPYMQSKAGYANCLLYMGNTKEAIQQCKELLELNPNDNQGIRYLLLKIYMEENKYDAALKLIDAYEEDETAIFNYNRILIEYGKNGITRKLTSLLQDAVEQNPHVVDYILGKKRIPEEVPEFIGFGDKTDAVSYAQEHVMLWWENPELMNWLKKQTSASVSRRSKK
ncbi:SEC-C metal-binding domain-containing protein [Aneurinibacillus sp. Ricciae_BoGa-3]|uniref:SEC-C metal-binding domain-containing protein n=1 Tax=Aneurinibacillus sp. Ricciae_BoGa-3 TaxID=3022697 RepID=UPI002341B978|nr:SEC-C metal-binding domain-containing protein [Aneurinibacillus sp. Ricciae_BoGa-3]WCK55215.1 SEC-C metal-binding domain-containing protein [Aneurinibacillus sp. Ricciae_BoGa-3]